MNTKSRRLDFAIPVLVTRHNAAHEKNTCHILELNPAGLLIETSLNLENGENITVHLLRDEIAFKVVSTISEVGSPIHRVQLAKLNADMNLDLYFSSFSKLAG